MEDAYGVEPYVVWGEGVEEEAYGLADGYGGDDGPSSYLFG